jgi:hypothetical protein
LLIQAVVCCLSLFCELTKNRFVTQWLPSITKFGPEIFGCPFAPA